MIYKKITFYYLLPCLMLSLSLQAQYQSVIDTNSTSWVRGSCFGIDLCGKDSSHYVIKKDTLIGSKLFKTIKMSNPPSLVSYFYIAEDTTSGEVWYKTADTSKDTSTTKIMQMNLALGDTFEIFNASIVVDSVYWINGKKHIRFDTTLRSPFPNHKKSYQFTMIEGVGTNFFGINYNTFLGTILICQKKNGILNYSNPIDSSTSTCELITGLPSFDLKEAEVNLYPNPTQERIKLQIQGNQTLQRIRLYDLLGREQEVKTIKESNQSYRILLHHLPPGIYLINIAFENGKAFSSKLVKE